MKLYRKVDGEIVGTQAAAGRDWVDYELGTTKPELIAALNAERLRSQLVADEGSDEHVPIISAPKGTYSSPLDARTTIAGIDAGMCSQAIRQMDGANLAKVIGAGIERMADLSAALPDEDLLS